MLKKGYFLLLFFCSFLGFSQVINIESLRKADHLNGFSGAVNLELELKKNTNKQFTISNDIKVQYTYLKSTFLFVNKLEFEELNGDKFTNKSVQHFRYNYLFLPKTSGELFFQTQRDKASSINFRNLIGLGTRFNLTKNTKYSFYIGTSVMYEYENSIGELNDVILKEFKGNVYFSFALFPSAIFTITSTTYYQPRLDFFADYRLLNETTLSLKLYKSLAFTTTFSYQYDTSPAFEITNEQYKLKNGIVYIFD